MKKKLGILSLLLGIAIAGYVLIKLDTIGVLINIHGIILISGLIGGGILAIILDYTGKISHSKPIKSKENFPLKEVKSDIQLEQNYIDTRKRIWLDFFRENYPDGNISFFSSLIDNLYLPYKIDFNKFVDNYKLVIASIGEEERCSELLEFYFEPIKGSNETSGTESLRKICISFVPRIISNEFFLSAYPDVYLWCSDKIKIKGEAAHVLLGDLFNYVMENESTFYDDTNNHIKVYENIVKRFVDEGNALECN